MTKIVLASIVVIFFAVSCAPNQGTIQKKEYRPARIQSTWTGKMATTTYHQDRYYFILCNVDDCGRIAVTKEEYELYELGQWFVRLPN